MNFQYIDYYYLKIFEVFRLSVLFYPQQNLFFINY